MKNIKVNMHQIKNDVNQGFNYPQEESYLTDDNGNINITCNDCISNFDLSANDCGCDENFETIANDCNCDIADIDNEVINDCDMDDTINNFNQPVIIEDIKENKAKNNTGAIATPTDKIDDKEIITSKNILTTNSLNENTSDNKLVMTCYEKHCELLEYFDNALECENKLYKKHTCTCKMTKEYKQ